MCRSVQDADGSEAVHDPDGEARHLFRGQTAGAPGREGPEKKRFALPTSRVDHTKQETINH